jgi:hypothetical protein
MDRQIKKVEQHDLSNAVWHGKGAVALGLIGKVRQADFEMLFNSLRTLKG